MFSNLKPLDWIIEIFFFVAAFSVQAYLILQEGSVLKSLGKVKIVMTKLSLKIPHKTS